MHILKQLKALADETRLRLLSILVRHELNVNELVQVLQMGQSRISRHLKVLTESSLLSSRRDGMYIYYQALADGPNQELVSSITHSLSQVALCREDLKNVEKVLDLRKQRTRYFFNRVAGQWEGLKQDILGDCDLGRLLLDSIPAGGVVADLGCGTGELLPHLAASQQKVIGVDSSPEMLALARKRQSSDQGRIDLRLGELEHLPLGNAEAGVAILNMVLHHLPLPSAGLREVARVLPQDGLCLITDFVKHDQEKIREKYGGIWLGFTRSELKHWLEAAGFRLQSYRECQVNHGLKIQIVEANKLEPMRRSNGIEPNV